MPPSCGGNQRGRVREGWAGLQPVPWAPPSPPSHPRRPVSWTGMGSRGCPCTLAPLCPAEVTIPEQKPAKGKGPKVGSKEKRSIPPESEVARVSSSSLLSPARGSLPPTYLAPPTWACWGNRAPGPQTTRPRL